MDLTKLGTFEILNFRLLLGFFFFENFKVTIVHVPYRETIVAQHIWGTFGLVAFKVMLGSLGALYYIFKELSYK